MMTLIHQMLAQKALQFAIEKATPEGKATIAVLLLLSMFSWTIIITKVRQLIIARRAAKNSLPPTTPRDPLDIQKRGEEFDGAPAYQLYHRGAEEVAYHLKNNPVIVTTITSSGIGEGTRIIWPGPTGPRSAPRRLPR